MCGRFANMMTWAEIHALYSLNDDPSKRKNTPARTNIAPTQDVYFAAMNDGELEIKEGRWWLVPNWTKEIPKYPMFNARSETAAEKSSFRDSFKSKRCLIPADGYYEWTKAEDGGKDPHYIYLPDHKPYSFAGLWAYNSTLELLSCTILTSKAAPEIKHLHDRMPIILPQSNYENWLDAETGAATAKSILNDNLGSKLVSHRVSREVNSSRASGDTLTEEI